MNVSSPGLLFTCISLDAQGSIPHTRGRAHSSQCCCQYRDGELNHRLPKVFIFHDVKVLGCCCFYGA